MILLIEILGAVALLLFGLSQVRNGIMRAYGTSLKLLARRTDGKVLSSVSAGCIIAVMLQSSTATALIFSTFTGQRMLSAGTAFLLVLGADVGTAIAAIVASQKISFIAPILIAVGYFGGRSATTAKSAGSFKAINGLGLVLLGLSLVSSVGAGISESADFVTVLSILSSQPAMMLILGVLITYLAHSSLATVLLTAGFIAAGLLDTASGCYLVLGANLGSGLLPVLATLRANKSSRSPLLANLMVRACCVFCAYGLAPFVFPLLDPMIWGLASPLIIHLGLNLSAAFFGVLGKTLWLRCADAFLSDDRPEADIVVARHLEPSLLNDPARALACAKREGLEMANIAQEMVVDAMSALEQPSEQLKQKTSRLDDGLDALFQATKDYLAKTMQSKLSPEESQLAQDVLSFTTSMEHVGDIVDCELMKCAEKKQKLQVGFSDAGLAEIRALHEETYINFGLAVGAFLTNDADLAVQLLDKKDTVRHLEEKSIAEHMRRLSAKIPESVDSSNIHLDTLHALRRINTHLISVAYLVFRANDMDPQKSSDT